MPPVKSCMTQEAQNFVLSKKKKKKGRKIKTKASLKRRKSKATFETLVQIVEVIEFALILSEWINYPGVAKLATN